MLGFVSPIMNSWTAECKHFVKPFQKSRVSLAARLIFKSE
jgi:hypothetical protein